MKKILSIVSISTLFTASLFAQQSAEAIFDAKCAACHIKTRPADRSKLIAPPIMGVMRHVKMQYPQKEQAVAFMVDYVQNPTKEKALCMPQKIARFGLMPSQKGNITKEELESVSSWLFDNFPPKGFRGMMHPRGI